jgi:putative intracellular protease/amidase
MLAAMIRSPAAGALFAAGAGIVGTLALWVVVTAPLAMRLLHPTPIAIRDGDARPPRPVAAADPAHATAAILLSQAGTEVTDFLAPYAILAASGGFAVTAVAASLEPAPTNGGLGVVPASTFARFAAAHPGGADVVVIPNVLDPDDPALLDWVTQQARHGALVVSICEGARLLARTGLLDGREATTHFAAIDELRRQFPRVRWRNDRRFVDAGPVISSAGVTAALDASLHVVDRVLGAAAAARSAAAFGLPLAGDVASAPPTLSARDLAIGVWNGALVWPKRRVFVPLVEGVDEIELAAVLDAYPRTFAVESATTTRGARPVRSRHGLILVPARAETAHRGGDLVVTPGRVAGDGSAFDRVLRDVARTFGGRTAALVADQLEAPAAGLGLESEPKRRPKKTIYSRCF